MKMLNALAFSRRLRQRTEFSQALEDARDYDRAEHDVPMEPRDIRQDPGKSSLDRARARLDIVSMLLQRRLFHQARVLMIKRHLPSGVASVTFSNNVALWVE